jgi:hypothetical protein
MKGSPAKRSLKHKGGAQTAPPQTVAEVLSKHVVLEVESIDRMYLNVIVGRLQILEGALRFIRQQRKARVLPRRGCCEAAAISHPTAARLLGSR